MAGEDPNAKIDHVWQWRLSRSMVEALRFILLPLSFLATARYEKAGRLLGGAELSHRCSRAHRGPGTRFLSIPGRELPWELPRSWYTRAIRRIRHDRRRRRIKRDEDTKVG